MLFDSYLFRPNASLLILLFLQLFCPAYILKFQNGGCFDFYSLFNIHEYFLTCFA